MARRKISRSRSSRSSSRRSSSRRRSSRSIKYYVLRQSNRDTEHVFSGHSPRQAALKAATRGHKRIELRERGRRNRDGTISIHIFDGKREVVNAPANRPSWLPARVKKPIVRKVEVRRIERL